MLLVLVRGVRVNDPPSASLDLDERRECCSSGFFCCSPYLLVSGSFVPNILVKCDQMCHNTPQQLGGTFLEDL